MNYKLVVDERIQAMKNTIPENSPTKKLGGKTYIDPFSGIILWSSALTEDVSKENLEEYYHEMVNAHDACKKVYDEQWEKDYPDPYFDYLQVVDFYKLYEYKNIVTIDNYREFIYLKLKEYFEDKLVAM